MIIKAFFVGLGLALAVPVAALAQTQTPPETSVGEIVVEGRRLEDLARTFVGEVGAPARSRGLARWRRGVCVGVANLDREPAQYLIDRISDMAGELGLRIGDPGCRATALIIFAADGAGTARGLVEADRRTFYTGSGATDRGLDALEAFQTSDAPVRWWHVSVPTDVDTGLRAIRLPGDEASNPLTGEPNAPVVRTFNASRIRSGTQDDLNKVIIIVDVDQLAGTTFEQLAAYVTMLTLAQVDPDGDTMAFDTILNLFEDPAAPPGLTDWDLTYLHALYRPLAPRRDTRSQARAVAGDLTRALREGVLEEAE